MSLELRYNIETSSVDTLDFLRTEIFEPFSFYNLEGTSYIDEKYTWKFVTKESCVLLVDISENILKDKNQIGKQILDGNKFHQLSLLSRYLSTFIDKK